MFAPLFLGAIHVTLTAPVAESIVEVTLVTQLGTVAAKIVVAVDHYSAMPHLLTALAINM